MTALQHPFLQRIGQAALTVESGAVMRVLPTFVEADGPATAMRTICEVQTVAGTTILAEVCGIRADGIVLTPLDLGGSAYAGARVTLSIATPGGPAGEDVLGRALDGLGRPIDGGGALATDVTVALEGASSTPLTRAGPDRMLATGLRAIDGLLPIGRGQRIGIFAASGVGKTTLLAQLARQVEADRCIVCLIGERGHEVAGLWHGGLAPDVKARSTMIAAAADQPAAMRVRAAEYAVALAARWREEGHHVLLVLDSVTRLAMALREVGLAAGEPPSVRGYTPSVFTSVARLIERCGAERGGGAVTAVLTVLTEGDEAEDPLAEAMKSLLDGHIVLSRTLAEQGRFPAIDVPRSVSRWAGRVASERHRALMRQVASALSVYEESRILIESGVYTPGANVEIDRAIRLRKGVEAFLQQGSDVNVPPQETLGALAAVVTEGTSRA
jgi:flagellum-specific ATP synthase